MNIHLIYQPEHETIAFAARELCRHLSATGSSISFHHNQPGFACKEPDDLTLCLCLAEARPSPLDDSYHICISPAGGSITGSNPRSILLGVYAFLKELGFRFLAPGSQGTLIPAAPAAEDFYMDIERTASLRHRGVCIEGANSLENILDFIDWLPKVGFNSFFLQFTEPFIFLNRWYDHINNPLYPPQKKEPDFYQDCYQKLEAAVKQRSLLLHTVGHGWTCEAIGYPSGGWLTAPRKPERQTAELLAEVNKKRAFIGGIPMNTNLCYANDTAAERFTDSVIRYLEEHTQVDFLHIWLADEPNHVCECEACKDLSPTDQYIQLLNRIDRRMEEHGLSCHLVFLLYQELLYPPVKEKLLHPEHFTLMFAPISRSFAISYPSNVTTVPLPTYRRNQMTLPTDIIENLSYLKEWQREFYGDSFVYDYPLGRAHYGDLGYLKLSRVIAGDIKSLPSLGMNGYISCQELRVALPNTFPNYLMGHLLFDHKQSCEELEQEYFQAAYGRHWQSVHNYLNTLSQLSDCDYFNGKGKRVSSAMERNYHMLCKQIQHFLPSIQQASEETSSEFELFFFKLLDYHAGYGVRLGKALTALAAGNEAEANLLFAEFCNFIRKQEASMQPYLDVYRIIEVSAKYTGFCLPEA